MRCFIAVGGEADLGAAAGPWLEKTRERFPELAVTPPQNLHLTLMFLGELGDAEVAAAREATVAAAASAGPGWAIDWGTPGAFPNASRPRVLWRGVGEGLEALVAAHGVLREQLDGRGLAVDDKGYRPHLTLARVRRPPLTRARAGEVMGWLEAAPTLPRLVVDSLVLYQSKLGRPAAVHEPLVEARLG